MKNCLITALLFVCSATGLLAQSSPKAYPLNWWVGMKEHRLELMVHQQGIGTTSVVMTKYAGVSLQSVKKTTNPNYLFLDLVIGAGVKPGNIQFIFSGKKVRTSLTYLLQERVPGNGSLFAEGVHASDLIYLVIPDRFSNGDTSNDRYAGLRDTNCDRRNPLLRHGGDLQGITNHLDYLKDLGVTTLWLTPVIENDMPLENESAGAMSGYHGYWFTDHYAIDTRLGGIPAYVRLIDSLHAKGMKIIQDAVYNHIGEANWMMKDQPTADWINHWPAYQGTNHREQAIFDVHGAAIDKQKMIDGWFVPHLPDLNLRNPLLARFLIQNAIWMTETFRLDGWRVDTYKYCDENFLLALNNALRLEYPKLSSFGEVTTNSVATAAYFCENNMNTPIRHNAPGVIDFPLSDAMLYAAQPGKDVNSSYAHLYETLAQDFLYKDPMRNCLCLDNHDRNRFFSEAGEDTANFEIGMGLLFTQRGIPQLYYGTEIGMKNFKNPSDAMVREDFPGGFSGDASNKFDASGRTAAEQQAFEFTRRLALFRKRSTAIGSGKLMQYAPANGLYVYFRYDARQTIMCVLNADSIAHPVNPADYAERTKDFHSATDVTSGRSFGLTDPLQIPPRKMWILELK